MFVSFAQNVYINILKWFSPSFFPYTSMQINLFFISNSKIITIFDVVLESFLQSLSWLFFKRVKPWLGIDGFCLGG